MHLTDRKPRAIRSVTADQNQKSCKLPSIDHASSQFRMSSHPFQLWDLFAQPLHACMPLTCFWILWEDLK
ncbi:hypothetical protein HanIR_Chr13g0622811 [Helianthus annuus]|nr:hypothetical protein HanIR_Chr13g0622811 [Helianthus annuus]